jgi:hypothetical protein
MSETPAWRGFAHRFGVIALLTGAATVRNMAVVDQRDDDDTDLDATDLDLLRRFEPVVRFNEGEYFLPASVESFVARAELWERTGPSSKRMVAPAGSLELDTLVERTQGHLAQHYLRLVSSRPTRAEYFGWQHRRDRPRFRPETRLGRVGVLTRLVDAAARVSLLARGRTPRGAQAAAAMLDRDRSDHGDHPYYGRVVHNAGYVVLQYWFFSYFNDWRSRAYGVNDHEGDWEQVSIYLVENDHGLRPAWIAFSAHDEQGADLRRRWDDPDLTFVDGHPVVFAGLGSHAGAVLPGEYLIRVRTHRLGRLTAIAPTDLPVLPTVGRRRRGRERRRDPLRRVQPRRRCGDRTRHGDELATGGDRRSDAVGSFVHGTVGRRHQRSVRRRAWARRTPLRAQRDRAHVVGRPGRLVGPRRDRTDRDRTPRGHRGPARRVGRRGGRSRDRREQLRRQLRADTIAAVADTTAEQRTLADLAARAVENADEQVRLAALRDGDIVVEHPHAHLSHRPIPLATDPKQRRRLLRIWATISTPLLFVLLALVVGSTDRSILGSALTLFVVVLGIEALSRRRLVTYLVRVALIVGMLSSAA